MKKLLFIILLAGLLVPVTSSATTTASTTEQTIIEIRAKLEIIVKALEKLKATISQIKERDRQNGTNNFEGLSRQTSKNSRGSTGVSSKSKLDSVVSEFSDVLSGIASDLLGVSQTKFLPENFGPEFDELIEGDENSLSPLSLAEIEAAIKVSGIENLAGFFVGASESGDSFSSGPLQNDTGVLRLDSKTAFLSLINTGKGVNGNPLLVLVMIKDGKRFGAVGAVSGVYARSSQNQRLSQGSKAPLPNGLYPVGKPLQTPKIYARTGQLSIPLSSELVPKSTREALFIHKRIGNGTAGCVGIITKEDHETVIKFVRDFYETNPQSRLTLSVKI